MRISGYKGFEMHKIHKTNTRWQPKMFVLGMALSGLAAFGEDRFMRETPNGFWETNLLATVISYSGQRTFMGTMIPAMDSSDRYPQKVWLYSIAPTNFAGITFTIHSCGPWSLSSVYPTNQLFVFPASVCSKKIATSSRIENASIIPHQTVKNYCPYRTFEKWFPVTDSQLKHWRTYLAENLMTQRKRVNELRDKMKDASDEKRRNGISNQVEHAEREIQYLQSEIEECNKQSKYFTNRIEWLKTQDLNPELQTTSD